MKISEQIKVEVIEKLCMAVNQNPKLPIESACSSWRYTKIFGCDESKIELYAEAIKALIREGKITVKKDLYNMDSFIPTILLGHLNTFQTLTH